MKNFLGKYKEHVAIVVYLGLLWGLVYFVVFPAVEKINAKANSIQEKLAEKEGSGRKLDKISKMKDQYEMIKNEEGKVQNLLSYDQAIVLIEAVEKLAAETGNKAEIKVEERENTATATKAKSVKKETAGKENEILPNLPSDKYLKMTISTSGSLEGLIDFIRRLENIQYWSDIISLEISSQKTESEAYQPNPMSPAPEAGSGAPQENAAEINSTLGVIFYLEN